MEIEERLAVLEAALKRERSKNRWWPLACVGIACVFGVVAATQPATQPHDILTVKELVVSDSPNGLRITISDGKVSLFDSAGKVRMLLGLSSDGSPGVYLCDSAGKQRTQIVAPNDPGPCVRLVDSAGKVRMALGSFNDGDPSVSLYDSGGKARATGRVQ